MRRILLLATAVSAVLLSSVSPAFAADAPPAAWEVIPAAADGGPRTSFDLTLDPGARVDDALVIRNRGTDPLSLQVWATDATTTPSGDLGLLLREEKPKFAGAWITPERDSVTIPGQGQVLIPFTVVVPSNEQPGDYVAGIVVSRSQAQSTDSGQEVLVDARVASRVYLRVPGELTPSASISDLTLTRDAPWWNFWSGEMRMDFTLTNTGNARLSPESAVHLSGPFDLDLADRSTAALPELLPGDSLRASSLGSADIGDFLTIAQVAAVGSITADVDVVARLTSGTDAVRLSAGATTVAIPWVPAAIVLALIAFAVARRVRRNRVRRRARAVIQVPAEQPEASAVVAVER